MSKFVKVDWRGYDIFILAINSYLIDKHPTLELSTLSNYFVLLLPRSEAFDYNHTPFFYTKSINFYPDQSIKTIINDLIALRSLDWSYLKNRCVN